MKKLFLIIICVLLMTLGSFSQAKKTPVKFPPKVPVANPQPSAEIPETEWNEIVKSFEAEDWNKTVLLSSVVLKKITADNEAKQLAQIRYFYLFALAGKVSQNRMTFDELKTLSDGLLGKEFVMPRRKILADCQKALNYICGMKDYYRTWRVTATNKAFTAIHSFEYVQLPEKVDIELNAEKEVVMGGKLLKIEFNPKKTTDWIMRLYFTAVIPNPR
jgi:hypothetical protein